jgi:hypothetical protein
MRFEIFKELKVKVRNYLGLSERIKAHPQDAGGGEGLQVWTVVVADHR